MGLYLYSNPNNPDEVVEVVQSIFQTHEYFKDGIKYNRVFTKPNANVSSTSKLDPSDSKGFVELTKNKKGNVGNLQDLSKELSEKRAKQLGKDPLKEKFYKDYSDKRNGTIHPQQQKENFDKLTKDVKLKVKKK